MSMNDVGAITSTLLVGPLGATVTHWAIIPLPHGGTAYYGEHFPLLEIPRTAQPTLLRLDTIHTVTLKRLSGPKEI